MVTSVDIKVYFWNGLLVFYHLKNGPSISVSPDHFIQKKIFFYIFLCVYNGLGISVWFFNGPIFGCPVPAEIDHSKTGLVGFSDGHCKLLYLGKWIAPLSKSRVEKKYFYTVLRHKVL
jgi:hypothetical protein